MAFIDMLNRRPGQSDAGTPDTVLSRITEGFARVRYARENPRVLRAAGQKIEPMSAERLRIVASHKQPWQSLAWGYRDLIPELRGAIRFRSQAISKARFFIAEITDEDEPIPVSLRHDKDAEKRQRVTVSAELCAAAEAELKRLPLDSGDSFIGVWSENFDVAGECWLHGYVDPATGAETWQFRSVLEVDVQGSNITVRDPLGRPRVVDLKKEELYRLWIPHAARAHLADSACNAATDVLEEIVLHGREQRAVSRSRIANNGFLLIPETMASSRNVRDDDNAEGSALDRFADDHTATVLSPIANEGDAGAVAPAIIFGTRDDIEAVRHLTFVRESSADLIDKLNAALGRMAKGLDIPPEIVTGMADVNHWTAWQIDASTFRNHLEPGIRVMADSLTSAFIRVALAGQFPAAELARIRVWYDGGQITENPNRRQDALDALDRILIGPKAGREALGFNDGDAPTPEEALQLIAAKNGIDQSTAAAILAWAADQEGAELPPSITNPPTQVGRPAPQRQLPPAAEPTRGDVGGDGPPGTAPTGVAASAARVMTMTATGEMLGGTMGMPAQEWQAWLDLQGRTLTVREAIDLALDQALRPDRQARALTAAAPAGYRILADDARALMEIERALRDQILAAADAEIGEALRRAGSRLRSKANANQELHASLRAVPVTDWAARIGRDQCLALNADVRYLLSGAWEKLSGKFSSWVSAAIDRVIGRLLAMLNIDASSTAGRAAAARVRSDMESRVDTAWAGLQADLDAYAEQLMFNGTAAEPDGGEVAEFTVPPVFVRNALATIGGTPDEAAGVDRRGVSDVPVNGLVNGMAVRGEFLDANAVHVGYEWNYGYEPRTTFEPHLNLDRVRFGDWGDEQLTVGEHGQWLKISHYHPGDHGGCLCSFTSVWALPDEPPADPSGIVSARLSLPPSRDMENILALANSDDDAGRTNTTAQDLRDQYLAVRGLKTAFLEGS